MYERTGRFYALFGPKAVVDDKETAFFRRWALGRRAATSKTGVSVTTFELQRQLAVAGFSVEQLYAGYDLHRPYAAGEAMMACTARAT